MSGRPQRRVVAGLLALAATLGLAAPAGAAVTIGSNLEAAPNGESCGYYTHARILERGCGMAQQTLIPAHVAGGGLTAPADGVIVRWRVRSGTPGPDVESVRMALLVLNGATAGPGSELVDLPLAEPGVHTFPTRLAIGAGERIGVQTILSNKTTEPTEAPISYRDPGAGGNVGTRDDWFTVLLPGQAAAPEAMANRELLLNADIEPDADHDGYGDETQDLCPLDPASHELACPLAADTRPPRTKLTYRPRQDFLGRGFVKVRVRSNEAAKVIADGQLEFRKGRGLSIWGLGGARRKVGARKKVVLRLRVRPRVRKAARRAMRNGRKVVIKVTVSARDGAGNESGKTIAVIRPKLS
jgi:hypothetical protein